MSIKSIITGKFEILFNKIEGRRVRIAGGILLASTIILITLVTLIFGTKAQGQAITITIALIFIPAITALVYFIVRFVEKEKTVYSHTNIKYAGNEKRNPDLICSKCGRSYYYSLALGAGNTVRVSKCRVCLLSKVYAVCEKCESPEVVKNKPCPQCGAVHQWEINSMQV